jgi:hypothetical protein
MAGGIIDLGLRPLGKLPRSRLVLRICVAIAALAVVLLLTLMPNPARAATASAIIRMGDSRPSMSPSS